MSDLPTGWVAAKLADVISGFQTGRNIQAAGTPARPGQYGVLKISAVTWGRFQASENKALLPGDQPLPHETVKAGDLLISRANTTVLVGAPVLVPEDHPCLMLPDKILRVLYRPEAVDVRYLLQALRSERARAHMEAEATGTSDSMRNLSQPKLRDIPIVLAPLPEQKRIAEKLDALLVRIDTCRTRLDRVPDLLRRFRRAVLEAATSGALTEDWRVDSSFTADAEKELQVEFERRRESHVGKRAFKESCAPDLTHWTKTLPSSWEVCSVSRFSACLDHLRVPVTRDKRSRSDGRYPYYGANGLVDMVDEFIFDEELVLVTEDETFYGREKPIAYRTSGRCWVNNHAHVLAPGSRVRADFLCYSLMHYDVVPWLTGTTGRAKLTQGVLNALPIAVPPLAEMEEIVRRVKALFALADSLESKYIAARTQIDRFTPALLAKAFRGELVPQDSKDEPADVLLARLRGEASGAGAAAVKRRSSPSVGQEVRSPSRVPRAEA